MCPIIMLFMMKGMHGGQQEHDIHLAGEVDELKKKNENLTKELEEQKDKQTV